MGTVTDWYGSYFANIQSEVQLLSSVYTDSILLSPSLLSKSIYSTVYTLAIVSVLHLLTLAFFRTRSVAKIKADNALIIKNSYQATNLLVNLTLGIYGTYTWLTVVPNMSTVPMAHKIFNFHEFIPIAAAQLGYNLWSLPMGLWVVGESKTMIIHHIAVICTSSLACFTTYGLRYYAPFLFGAFGLSSVPLAVMNSFKNNKVWADKHSPISETTARVSFAVLFLLVRVILGTPQMYDIMRSASILCYTCETNYYRIPVAIFCVCWYFLAPLQLYWGWLIVKGLYKLCYVKTTKDD